VPVVRDLDAMECLASSVALTILLLAASAAARCPDPEAHSTIIMNVQGERAKSGTLQAATAAHRARHASAWFLSGVAAGAAAPRRS